MTKKEFEEFKLAYEQLRMQDQDWLFELLGKRTIDITGKSYKVSDLMKIVANYDSYRDLPPVFRSNKISFSEEFRKAAKELQVIAKDKNYVSMDENDPDVQAMQKPNGPSAESVDFSFFARIKGEFSKSRYKSWTNSDAFNKMDKKLDELTAYLQKKGDIHSPEYTKLLDELEKSADVYLTHKVKHGTNKNAIGKVNGATAIKEYIAERRKELFRDQVQADTDKLQASLLPKRAKSTQQEINFAKKEAEYKNTASLINEYWNKHHEGETIDSQLGYTMEGPANYMYCLRHGIRLADVAVRVDTRDALAMELIRNEILASGGEKSPIVENFLKNPNKFLDEIQQSEAFKKLSNSRDNIELFAEKNCRENVVDALSAGLPTEVTKHIDSSIVYNKHLIEDEAEKNLITELPTEEDSRDRADTEVYTTLDLASAYSNLAKFAKEGYKEKDAAEKAAEYEAEERQRLLRRRPEIAKLKRKFNQIIEDGIVIDDEYRDEDSLDEDELEEDEVIAGNDLIDEDEIEDEEREADELEDAQMEADEPEEDGPEADKMEADQIKADEPEEDEPEELHGYDHYISKSKSEFDKALHDIGNNTATMEDRQNSLAKYILSRTVYEQAVQASQKAEYSKNVEGALEKNMAFLNNPKALSSIKKSKPFQELFSDLKAEDCTKDNFNKLYRKYFGEKVKETQKKEIEPQVINTKEKSVQDIDFVPGSING